MNVPNLIFLCGFMGAGKSTIGRSLADELGNPFLDLDDRIVERAGKTIPQIFDDAGEGAFRTAERKALLDIVRNDEGVVALGGGSLQNQHLLDHLKVNGLLVHIKAPIAVILERIAGDTNRPLLLDEDGSPKDEDTLEKDLSMLYQDRLPLYEQAVITLEVSTGQSVQAQTETLMNKIRNHVAYR